MIAVLIATKGRPAKLNRCLASIPAHIHVAIHATSRDDVQTDRLNTSVTVGPENIVEAFNLLAARTTESHVLPVPDDVRFPESFFANLETWIANNSAFMVIGCPVTNLKHHDAAVTLVSRQAVTERGFLFDPRFLHFFIDNEIGDWAKQRRLFSVCPKATLEHFHPEVSGEYDATHRHRRMDKWRHDKAVWDQIRGKQPAPVSAIPQTS